jgi:DNA-directed RNA polymerase subunit M/transcription elongation factor TFIIS
MSYIVWSRKCKKCKGQFYFEENEDGAALVCIQCGYTEHIADHEREAVVSAIQPANKKQLTRV